MGEQHSWHSPCILNRQALDLLRGGSDSVIIESANAPHLRPSRCSRSPGNRRVSALARHLPDLVVVPDQACEHIEELRPAPVVNVGWPSTKRTLISNLTGARQTIMVVDDDPFIREVISVVLESELEVQVVQAEDGQDALRQLGGTKLAAIVTDVRMPNVDGVQLIRLLRGNVATHGIPIIVVAASREARNDAVSAGADDYVDKPFGADDLVAKVRQHLDYHPHTHN
jgi:CheY-like chemotaxis protein